MPTIQISWKEAVELHERLSDEISKVDIDLTAIVAVARGGFIPARLISNSIGVKHLAGIGVDYEDTTRQHVKLYCMPHFSHSSQRILLVEDLLESGRSLGAAKAALVNEGHQVITAAAYHRSWSVVVPDATLGVNDSDIKFPWESE